MSQITEEFEEVPVQSRGFGILDVGYRSAVMNSCIMKIAVSFNYVVQSVSSHITHMKQKVCCD